jgi:hypothetical protein
MFSYFGIHGRRAVDLIARILILMSVTWGVLAVLAVFVSKVAQGPAGENFFLDFAAYLQLLIGLLLFVIAERVIGEHTREAAGYFLAAGVIPPEELPTIEAINRKVERLRKWIVPDLVCLALAVALALVTILPKESPTVCISWHTTPREAGASLATAKDHLRAKCEEDRTEAERKREAGKKLKGPERELQEAAQELKSAAGELRASVRDVQRSEGKPADEQAKAKGTHPEVIKKLNFAGWWAMLVTLPILNYWWLRWIWKIALWSWFLYRMSRVPLILVPSHPDATGGIGFVSDVQTKFGLAILAFGISNIASTVGYASAPDPVRARREDADRALRSALLRRAARPDPGRPRALARLSEPSRAGAERARARLENAPLSAVPAAMICLGEPPGEVTTLSASSRRSDAHEDPLHAADDRAVARSRPAGGHPGGGRPRHHPRRDQGRRSPARGDHRRRRAVRSRLE